jgi:hypothetical protein
MVFQFFGRSQRRRYPRIWMPIELTGLIFRRRSLSNVAHSASLNPSGVIELSFCRPPQNHPPSEICLLPRICSPSITLSELAQLWKCILSLQSHRLPSSRPVRVGLILGPVFCCRSAGTHKRVTVIGAFPP